MKAKDWDKDEEGEDGKTRDAETRTAREGDRHRRGKSEGARDSEVQAQKPRGRDRKGRRGHLLNVAFPVASNPYNTQVVGMITPFSRRGSER